MLTLILIRYKKMFITRDMHKISDSNQKLIITNRYDNKQG